MQQFNTAGGVNRTFWEVTVDDLLSQASDDYQSLRNATDVPLPPVEVNDIRNITPWLRMTGWHIHTQPYHASDLVNLAKTPRNDDPLLPGLKDAVKSYFQAAVDLIPQTNLLVLQRLNTDDPAKGGISNTPLRKMQVDRTLDLYSQQTASLLAMLLRPKPDGYTIPLSDAPQTSLDRLMQAILDKEDLEGCIHAVLMGIWATSWEVTEENPIPCPTMRYLALTTLHLDGSHSPPHLVTPLIAKLTYCMRLAFLQQIKYLTDQNDFPSDSPACDLMQRWFTEKLESSFNNIRSLQHYATSQAMQTMSVPRIWWLDREKHTEMLYKGDKITVADIKGIFLQMENATLKAWEEKIILGTGLHIDYTAIQDDPSNRTMGHSFLLDQRNPQFHNPYRLRDAILADANLRTQFALFRHGTWTWNFHALQSWLWDYADFLVILLGRCEMLSGAPSRGTELTSMTFCNTKTQDIRNLCILGNHVTLLRDYHKGTQMTGYNKLIPHALDGFTSDMIIQALSIAHPFAVSAAHICFPGQPEIAQLYRQHIFVNHHKLFESPQLSHTMADFSLPTLGWNLGINSWRHISTAFKRHLCRLPQDLLDDEDDTASALQAGHSLATENRIYGVSADTLPSAASGAAEDIIPLFLDVSTHWQKLFGTVPGGLMLTYKQARAEYFDQLVADGTISKPTIGRLRDHAIPAILPAISEDRIINNIVEKLQPQFSGIQNALSLITDKLSDLSKPAVKPPMPPPPPPAPAAVDEWDNLPWDDQMEGLYVQDKPIVATTAEALDFNDDPPASPPRMPSPLPPPAPPREPDMAAALAVLRGLLKIPGAGWTSEAQYNTIRAVLAGQTDVLSILPTGGGKTMAILIPTLMDPTQISIVYLPLKSLMTDYIRKLPEMGIRYQVFD
ncbi:hypothetical protein BJ138DRAFT_1020380, partial [Hygrophoropsis aurantiaca]